MFGATEQRHPDSLLALDGYDHDRVDFVGGLEAQLLTTRGVFRIPAHNNLPADSLPPWIAEVEQAMVPAEIDWALLAQEGPGWMAYWDEHVRGKGRR